MSDYEYENLRRVIYGAEDSEYAGATFIPVCQKCGRYVKADPTIICLGDTVDETVPNAECSKCGRTNMIFEGFHTHSP
jgi:hypothetical protein